MDRTVVAHVMANLHSFGGLSCLSRGRVGVACTDAGPVDGVQSFGVRTINGPMAKVSPLSDSGATSQQVTLEVAYQSPVSTAGLVASGLKVATKKQPNFTFLVLAFVPRYKCFQDLHLVPWLRFQSCKAWSNQKHRPITVMIL